MKYIGGRIVALLVAVVLGYSLLLSGSGGTAGGTAGAGNSSGSGLLDGLQDAILERVKAEIGELVSHGLPDGLPDGLSDLLPGGLGISGPSTARGAPVPPSAAEARQQLAGLRVTAAGSMASYDREAFEHWSTAQDFGWKVSDVSCDTRNAALIRDAKPGAKLKIGDYCDVESGKWVDPYTGNVYTDPADMDIDHVVALGNAWRSGASRWTDGRREAYANDPEVLLTVEDDANQEKSDFGPEEWQPPNRSYWCEFSRRYISIKNDWGLSVNVQEKAALREMLSTC